MVLPIKDDNPTRRPAVVTVAVLVACLVVWAFWQWPRDGVDDARFTLRQAAIPEEVTSGEPLSVIEVARLYDSPRAAVVICNSTAAERACFPDKSVWLAVVVSLFLHGSWLHLLGNLLFLWVFGNNIEDKLTSVGFAVFYVAGGVVATLAHVLASPGDLTPIVGASGAIAAVMGAYAVWFPRARVLTLVFLVLIVPLRLRAAWVLGIWFVLQFFTSPNSGVAWVAHVGGFVFGALFGVATRRRIVPPPPPVPPAFGGWPPPAAPYA